MLGPRACAERSGSPKKGSGMQVFESACCLFYSVLKVTSVGEFSERFRAHKELFFAEQLGQRGARLQGEGKAESTQRLDRVLQLDFLACKSGESAGSRPAPTCRNLCCYSLSVESFGQLQEPLRSCLSAASPLCEDVEFRPVGKSQLRAAASVSILQQDGLDLSFVLPHCLLEVCRPCLCRLQLQPDQNV